MNIIERAYNSYSRDGLSWMMRRALEEATIERLASLPKVYWRIAPHYYRFLRSFDTDNYHAPLHPYKLVAVDPNQINRFSGREYPPWRNRPRMFGAVEDGEWDRQLPVADPYLEEVYLAETFEKSLIHRALKARFEQGISWEETEFVQRQLDWLDHRDRVWIGCRSKSDILNRCELLDQLYETIRDEGYQTQREISLQRKRDIDFIYRISNEIIVDIGRDGTLLFISGRHRLSIAKILNLDRIPVAFLVRHEKWMKFRDNCFERGYGPPHPDLLELFT